MKLKLGVVGPTGAGKSTICNLLGNEGFGDNANSHLPYRPTHSIRIVEFTLNNIELTKYSMEVDCQLWEMGGNPRLKQLWSGMQNNLDGIVMVYDVNNETHVRDASAFYMHFVTHAPTNISTSQCLIVGNIFRGQRETGVQKIVGIGQRVRHIAVNLDDDASYLREEFRHYITGVSQVIFDREKANMMANATSKTSTRFRAQDFKCRTRAARSPVHVCRPTRPVSPATTAATTTITTRNPTPTTTDMDPTNSQSNQSTSSPRKRSTVNSHHPSRLSPQKLTLNSIIEKFKVEIEEETNNNKGTPHHPC